MTTFKENFGEIFIKLKDHNRKEWLLNCIYISYPAIRVSSVANSRDVITLFGPQRDIDAAIKACGDEITHYDCAQHNADETKSLCVGLFFFFLMMASVCFGEWWIPTAIEFWNFVYCGVFFWRGSI